MQSAFKNIISALRPALGLWCCASLIFGAGMQLYQYFFNRWYAAWLGIGAAAGAAIGSLPILLALLFILPLIKNTGKTAERKTGLLALACMGCTLPYGLIAGFFFATAGDGFYGQLFAAGILKGWGAISGCALAAILLRYRSIVAYFTTARLSPRSIHQTFNNMETVTTSGPSPENKFYFNRIFLKAIITGLLILGMMIPTLFVSSLITERQARHQEVVKEVSSKWAFGQTLAGPYLYLPYRESKTGEDGKTRLVSEYLLLLPENLSVDGNMVPEIRPRSIYKVLLYKTDLKASGNIIFNLPKEMDPASLQLADARICFSITDFKGIAEKLTIRFNNSLYELSPGLPVNDIDSNGLSAPVTLTPADLGKSINFSLQLKINGSDQLHFVPLSGNSRFTLRSSWTAPSFDGNILPANRTLDKNGFTADWIINKANLPFGTLIKHPKFDKDNFAFGVSMVQPADQYAKTMRSVKYAILFIGLTFSLFFIVELTQKKPFHPVQYMLVGLALVIFYTLLLSLSEFILFDQAYLAASLATILLITWYAKAHFRRWKTASLFGSILTCLYGFIFILIRLEDTALLLGSIGLFLILALVMFGSRKIDWYPAAAPQNNRVSA